jgi:hypothetical protein
MNFSFLYILSFILFYLIQSVHSPISTTYRACNLWLPSVLLLFCPDLCAFRVKVCSALALAKRQCLSFLDRLIAYGTILVFRYLMSLDLRLVNVRALFTLHLNRCLIATISTKQNIVDFLVRITVLPQNLVVRIDSKFLEHRMKRVLAMSVYWRFTRASYRFSDRYPKLLPFLICLNEWCLKIKLTNNSTYRTKSLNHIKPQLLGLSY